MENTLNSCLMWAVGLYTPVDLGAVFKDADLKDTGVELDSHITLLFASGKVIPREEIMKDIETILGPESFADFLTEIKSDSSKEIKVFDLFDLGNFENDSDYVVLKLQKSHWLYPLLGIINKGLRVKYNVGSDFADYCPHVSLAELQVGRSKEYLENEALRRVLEDSLIDFEDVVMSYGASGEEDRKQYFLTTEKNLARYFRLGHLRERTKELRESGE